MMKSRQTSAALCFAAILILGGWVWSQDDSAESPGSPATDVQDAERPAIDPAQAAPSPGDTTTDAAETGEILPVDGETGDNETGGETPTPSAMPVVQVAAEASSIPESSRWQGMILSLWIFVLAVFLGIELISKVPPTLHTPLMSGSNAISGITIVGAVIVAAAMTQGLSPITNNFARFLGFIAVALAMINAVGGFLVTHRMLAMFARK